MMKFTTELDLVWSDNALQSYC